MVKRIGHAYAGLIGAILRWFTIGFTIDAVLFVVAALGKVLTPSTADPILARVVGTIGPGTLLASAAVFGSIAISLRRMSMVVDVDVQGGN